LCSTIPGRRIVPRYPVEVKDEVGNILHTQTFDEAIAMGRSGSSPSLTGPVDCCLLAAPNTGIAHMFLDDRDAQLGTGEPRPWDTPPSNLGDAECRWCWRYIYSPALPCSVKVIAGLAELPTAAGLGDRCRWELATRVAAIEI
jgi:hypothetical protein